MPLITINNSKNLLLEVVDIARKNNIKEIVMGESKNFEIPIRELNRLRWDFGTIEHTNYEYRS
jgi:hypothetical protein